jgi:hypothetical protein
VNRSSLPVLLLLAGVSWSAGQALLPDVGATWAARLEAVAAARTAETLSAGLLVLAGVLLVVASVTAARRSVTGRGAAAIRVGTMLLAVGGVWLAAGRGAFNLLMHRLTDPGVSRESALAVADADLGAGFVPMLLTLPVLLVAPVVLGIGVWRTGRAGILAPAALACWVVGTAVFIATEFTVKAGEIAGIALAGVGLAVLGLALVRSTGVATGGQGADVVGASTGAATTTA